jgi:hypothetical protein
LRRPFQIDRVPQHDGSRYQVEAAGSFDTSFYVVQTIEVIAGPINLTLMGLNVRDGLRMAG